MTEERSAGESADRDDLVGDVVAEAAIPRHPQRDGPRARRVLAAVFWLLAILSVLFGSVAVWTHQTLLTGDGWGGIVEDVIGQDEVSEAISVTIVTQLSKAVDVGDLVAQALPGPDLIAEAVTGVVEQRIVEVVEQATSSEAFQEAFVKVNKAGYDAALTVIRRGDSDALTSEQGLISINVLPVVESVLHDLQDAGLIDADREIPGLTDFELSSSAIAALEDLLGRDLPDDLGTIVLVESERLETVQTVIRWFDLITIWLVGLWLLFTALALWLSERRARMVVWLSGGAIVALFAARFLARAVLGGIGRNHPELEKRVVLDAIIETSVDSLASFTLVLMVIALAVALVAFFYERRERSEAAAEG